VQTRLTFSQGGSSEEYLALLKWKERGLVMDTKYFPNVHGMMGRPVTHLGAKDMRGGLEDSLNALGTDSVDLWYLHAPDRSIPIEDTLAAVHELYKEKKFKKWGVSNYMAWEGSFFSPSSPTPINIKSPFSFVIDI
jgi:aflatoxin B1 aldehyde reductase